MKQSSKSTVTHKHTKASLFLCVRKCGQNLPTMLITRAIMCIRAWRIFTERLLSFLNTRYTSTPTRSVIRGGSRVRLKPRRGTWENYISLIC